MANAAWHLVKLLKILNDDLNTLLVAAAGNDAVFNPNKPSKAGAPSADLTGYPAKFLAEGVLPDLLVVGATDMNSRRAAFSQRIVADEKAIVHAPGMLVECPTTDPPLPGKPPVAKAAFEEQSGTSFGRLPLALPPRSPAPSPA